MAAGIAIAAGLLVRDMLLQFLPGTQIAVILARVPSCVRSEVSIYLVYLALARLFGIRELARLQRLLLRRWRSRQPALR